MIRNEITVRMDAADEESPIALMVQKASNYSCSIYLESEGKRVNAKSIMGMMSMAMIPGDKITVETSGEDEQAANDMLVDFLLGKNIK